MEDDEDDVVVVQEPHVVLVRFDVAVLPEVELLDVLMPDDPAFTLPQPATNPTPATNSATIARPLDSPMNARPTTAEPG